MLSSHNLVLIASTILDLVHSGATSQELVKCTLSLKLGFNLLVNDLAEPPLIRIVRVLVDREAIVTLDNVLWLFVHDVFFGTLSLDKLENDLIFKDFIVREFLDSIEIIDVVPDPLEVLRVVGNRRLDLVVLCTFHRFGGNVLSSSHLSDVELHLALNVADKVITELNVSLVDHFSQLVNDSVSHVEDDILQEQSLNFK